MFCGQQGSTAVRRDALLPPQHLRLPHREPARHHGGGEGLDHHEYGRLDPADAHQGEETGHVITLETSCVCLSPHVPKWSCTVACCQVNRLKNKYRREGVEHPDDVVDLLAKELNISKAKATGVGVRLSYM